MKTTKTAIKHKFSDEGCPTVIFYSLKGRGDGCYKRVTPRKGRKVLQYINKKELWDLITSNKRVFIFNSTIKKNMTAEMTLKAFYFNLKNILENEGVFLTKIGDGAFINDREKHYHFQKRIKRFSKSIIKDFRG